LTVESREPSNFARREIEILSRLVKPAALALDLLYMNEVINEYVIVDETTGVYSRKFFFQRIDEELQRADDDGIEASLLQITVDHAHELLQRYGREGFDRAMITLAKAVRSGIRAYDIVGRLESNRFGILLVNTAANEAYLWAEKIRKTVAGHIINHEGKSFSMTISVGVAGALEGMKREELLTNTSTVLSRASESGGNTVRVF
jgi:diguanylate cyclase (GGDEF)-like protein